MSERKDLLGFCRLWNNKKYKDFIECWLSHNDLKERIRLYQDLNWWKQRYELGSIEVAITVMLILWERVEAYERSILWKDWIRTLREPEQFQVFEAYHLMKWLGPKRSTWHRPRYKSGWKKRDSSEQDEDGEERCLRVQPELEHTLERGRRFFTGLVDARPRLRTTGHLLPAATVGRRLQLLGYRNRDRTGVHGMGESSKVRKRKPREDPPHFTRNRGHL